VGGGGEVLDYTDWLTRSIFVRIFENAFSHFHTVQELAQLFRIDDDQTKMLYGKESSTIGTEDIFSSISLLTFRADWLKFHKTLHSPDRSQRCQGIYPMPPSDSMAAQAII
jgi:hypothetical protein